MDPGMGRPSIRTVDPARPWGDEQRAGLPEITRVDILPLQPGDRLIVHVDGTAGMSGGGAARIGEIIRARLKLDDLPFDVPMLVVSPGIRVEVTRPA
jgi:hypothetical protein